MPLSDNQFRSLTTRLATVLLGNEQRQDRLNAAFPNDTSIRTGIGLDAPTPLAYARKLVMYLRYDQPVTNIQQSSLVIFLRALRDDVGGDLAAELDNYLATLESDWQQEQKANQKIALPPEAAGQRTDPAISDPPTDTNSIPKLHLFISYSRTNETFANRLISDLQERGYVVWIDTHDLKPGTTNWDQAIRDAIQKAQGAIFVASPEARRSPFVQDEMSLAQDMHLPIFPVWAAGENYIDCVPLGMGRIQYADLRHENYESGLGALISTLKEARGGASQVSASAPDSGPQAETTPSHIRNPYKGLRSFEKEDAPDFFGREALINELLGKVKERSGIYNDVNISTRFVAVVGPSGSGKSSVVRAGLVPRVEKVDPTWKLLPVMVPTTHPLESLTLLLADQLKVGMADIRRDLEEKSARGLHLYASRIAANGTSRHGANQRLILIIDQFEEVFASSVTEEERQQFIELIVQAVTERRGPLFVIIAMRADFSDRALHYNELGRLITANSSPVLPMSMSEIRDVILRPLAGADIQAKIDDDVIAELVFEFHEQADALPLLEFLLETLFEKRQGNRLTNTAYLALGGLKGALARYAESIYVKLNDESHWRLTQELFLRLVEPGLSFKDATRRRAALSELDLVDPVEQRIIRECADIFVAARLLTTNKIGDKTTIEISHEALIREWPRVRDWISAATEQTRALADFRHATNDWLQNNQAKDLLYPRLKLERIRPLLGKTVLSQGEAAFVKESEQGILRRRRRTASLLIPLAVLILLILAVVGYVVRLKVIQNAAIQLNPLIPIKGQNGSAAFSINQYEVSYEQYGLCVEAKACNSLPSLEAATNIKLPVTSINAFDAERFCNWLSQRLPTASEHDLAAMGPEKRTWPWGNSPGPDANHVRGWILPDPQPPNGPVAVNDDQFKAGDTPDHVRHLLGNVWEWTRTYTTDTCTDQTTCTTFEWDGHSIPEGDKKFFVEGLSWQSDMLQENPLPLATIRNPADPKAPFPSVGFRCASDAISERK